jgi:hypothetical protein
MSSLSSSWGSKVFAVQGGYNPGTPSADIGKKNEMQTGARFLWMQYNSGLSQATPNNLQPVSCSGYSKKIFQVLFFL